MLNSPRYFEAYICSTKNHHVKFWNIVSFCWIILTTESCLCIFGRCKNFCNLQWCIVVSAVYLQSLHRLISSDSWRMSFPLFLVAITWYCATIKTSSVFINKSSWLSHLLDISWWDSCGLSSCGHHPWRTFWFHYYYYPQLPWQLQLGLGSSFMLRLEKREKWKGMERKEKANSDQGFHQSLYMAPEVTWLDIDVSIIKPFPVNLSRTFQDLL